MGIEFKQSSDYNLIHLSLIFTLILTATMEHNWHRERLLLIKKQMMMLITLLSIAITYIFTPEEAVVRLAYHTSILTGAGWVMELLAGHPLRIRTELGVSRETFIALIEELHGMGHNDSKFVSLEEQLAIFLYASVTGLTVRHLGERFQRSNETISKYSNSFHINY